MARVSWPDHGLRDDIVEPTLSQSGGCARGSLIHRPRTIWLSSPKYRIKGTLDIIESTKNHGVHCIGLSGLFHCTGIGGDGRGGEKSTALRIASFSVVSLDC